MGRRGGAKFTGFEKVRKKMFKLGEQGADAYRAAVYVEALSIADDAVERAPAVTGRLRNSHWVSWPTKLGKVTIGFATVYAAAVEYGLRLGGRSDTGGKRAGGSRKPRGNSPKRRKSSVGGPGYFRGAISAARGGQVARIVRTAKRYFKARIGIGAAIDNSRPKTEEAARKKGERSTGKGEQS